MMLKYPQLTPGINIIRKQQQTNDVKISTTYTAGVTIITKKQETNDVIFHCGMSPSFTPAPHTPKKGIRSAAVWVVRILPI